MKPLAVDLCAGLGGWADGLLAEGWDVVGFDIVRHEYGSQKYPAQLVLQDIRTLDGRQFRGKVSLIVASPPCQKYSYMSMPWTRAKDLARWYRDAEHPERLVELNALFNACLRIGHEAECPIVIENVRGAQPWVGRARWAFGSFMLWGDVPALMPITRKAVKVPTMGAGWYPPDHPKHVPGLAFNGHADRNLREGIKAGDRNKARATGGHEWTTGFDKHTKNDGGSWFNVAHNTTSGHGQNPDGRKGRGGSWLGDNKDHPLRATSSGSSARKAASAHIAKIPLTLARHIARSWLP